MTPRRITVKFFVSPDPGAALDLEPFIPLFHRCIQKASVEGLLVDVADYAHVPNGPGVVLIGHDVDYAIDSTGGRTGLLTVCKRAGVVPLGDLIRDTLRRALVAIRAIETDDSVKLSFSRDAFEVRVVDRLAAQNDDSSYAKLCSEVTGVVAAAWGNAPAELARAGGDPREPLGVRVVAAEAVDLERLISGLGSSLGSPLGSPLASPRAGIGADVAVPGPAVPGQTEWDVSVEQLKQLRDTAADFVLVDVREQAEVEICEIGGVLIPLGSLPTRMKELDERARIIVHCHTGGRSAQAVRALRAAGFEDVWNLQGGIRAWIQRIDSSLSDY